jgi:hypothetical protein
MTQQRDPGYLMSPYTTPDTYSTQANAPFSDDAEPEQFDDWDDEEPDAGGFDTGVWEYDLETLAAVAVARPSGVLRTVGPTVVSTLERWR